MVLLPPVTPASDEPCIKRLSVRLAKYLPAPSYTGESTTLQTAPLQTYHPEPFIRALIVAASLPMTLVKPPLEALVKYPPLKAIIAPTGTKSLATAKAV
jgi:hypothetical protein